MTPRNCLDAATICNHHSVSVFMTENSVSRPHRLRSPAIGPLVVALAAGLQLLFVSAQSGVAATPDPLEGVWEGTYICYQGETAASVALKNIDASGVTRGIFTFGSLQGQTNARAGSYNISGAFDRTTQQLVAVPAGWIDQPEDYVQVGFTATLDQTGQTLTGRVDFQSCSSIVLHRRATS